MLIPLDVPTSMHPIFLDNHKAITHDTNNLMLFAVDQKIEHLNGDFYGNSIDITANQPDHIFQIANRGRIGALATHLGLIARYGAHYKDINYIIKLNAKTNLIKSDSVDPLSRILWSIEDVINFKKSSGLKIRGIGYTIYLGSKYEPEMLADAAQAIFKAHQNGLVAILWVYIRGNNIKEKNELELTTAACGVANSLGADFAKIKTPKNIQGFTSTDILKIATQAAGNTKIICSGGKSQDPKDFLKELYLQITEGKTAGNATGRNIFQRSLKEAIAMTNAISAIVYHKNEAKKAIEIFESMK